MDDVSMTRSKAPDTYIIRVSVCNMSESLTMLTCWTQANGAHPKDSEISKVLSYYLQTCV